MDIQTIRKKSIKVYNIDIDVIKMVLYDITDNNRYDFYKTTQVLLPIEDYSVNINVPEKKYGDIYPIIINNKTLENNNLDNNIHRVYDPKLNSKHIKANLSRAAISKLLTSYNNYMINYRLASDARIKSILNVTFEKRVYVNRGGYIIKSYKNPSTDDEIFVKYMDFKRHIFLALMFGVGSNIFIRLFKVKNMGIISSLLSVFVMVTVYGYIKNLYSKTPNTIIKRINKFFSRIQQDFY